MAFLKSVYSTSPNSQIPPPQKDQFYGLLFGSRSGYDRLSSDPAAKKILESLDIGATYDPGRLGNLVSIFNAAANSGQVGSNAQLSIFYNLLESLKNIEHSCSSLLGEGKLGSPATKDGILDLQIVDYDNSGIDATRLREIVSTLIRLHTDFARILGISNDRLRFVMFDSGSDLDLRIQAAKAIIESVGVLLSEWWVKIRFWKYDTFEKNMEALTTGLAAMDTVQESVKRQVIDQETGEILKKRVLKEVDTLIKLGVSHPINEAERIDNRALLLERRDTKLLGTGSPAQAQDQSLLQGSEDESDPEVTVP